MFRRSGRYKSIVNNGKGGGRENSNGRDNQHNQRQNFMLLQQDSNGSKYNGCPP